MSFEFLPQEVIRRKRNGDELTDPEIQGFVSALTDGSLNDGQAAAFAMAVYFQGMSSREQSCLTLSMLHSGEVMNWSDMDLTGPVADKHSTGGVGDKVSLMLGPMAAACGLFVPMISGRGLGHTGGTLDKLESIPGYNAVPDRQLFKTVVKDVGCAIIGQTSDLAPADKRFYAIRDVTATVESIPLITASILSKKMAAGLDALVMDVKFGSGAFMSEFEEAQRLSANIAAVAGDSGLPTSCLLTDMNSVLGSTAGNALEVFEAINFLTGTSVDPRLLEVTVELVARMLVTAGVQPELTDARDAARHSLASGAAAEVFGQMVSALGGPADLIEHPESHLPRAKKVVPFFAIKSGYVVHRDVRSAGNSVVSMGGGRTSPDQAIDHSVGLANIYAEGTFLSEGDPVCQLHLSDESQLVACEAALSRAFVIEESEPTSRPVCYN